MAELLELLLAETTALRAPLPGDSPSGADIALEPEFERIKGEIDKLTNLSGSPVDWRAVMSGAEELLSARTKDLRLALWHASGAIDRGDWRAVARSLVLVRALATDFWDTMHPARPKARNNIVAWFAERSAPLVAELRVDRANADAIVLCESEMAALDGCFSEKLGEIYGGIGGLRSAFKGRVREIPPPPAPPAEKVETPASAAAPASDWADDDDAPAPAANEARGSGVALSTRASDAAETSRAAGDALVELARAMRAEEPTRAWAYRLHRTGIWLPFDSAPRDPIAAPAPEMRASLQALLSASRFSELLEATEVASARSPFWLCAQRFACVAAERLGLAYAGVRETVGRDAADVVRRWPDLVDRHFDDGTPLASDETRAFFREEVARWQMVIDRGKTAGATEDEKLKRRMDEARDLVLRGHHAEGLALASELARRASDERARFKADLAVSELAIHAGAFDVARALLERLCATADARSLETWEPSLAAALYSALVRALANDAREDAIAQRARVFDRLCKVDPGAALRSRLNGANGTASASSDVWGHVFSDARSQSTANPSSPSTSSTSARAAQVTQTTRAPEPASPAAPSASSDPESEWADD